MTVFEYIAIAISIVFSFTVLRVVSSLPFVLRTDRVYWVHVGFIAAILFYIVNSFWAYWSYRDVDWTYLRYVVALAGPAIYYFVAGILVSNDPANVESWRNYYFSIRKRLFAGVCMMAVISVVLSTVVGSVPLLHPFRASQIMLTVVGLVGVSTPDPRVHAGLSLVSVTATSAYGFLFL